MGSALAKAAVRKLGGASVIISDNDNDKRKKLAGELKCSETGSNEELVRSSEYILLAVKPNIIRDVARAFAPVLAADKENSVNHVIVTIAAGISTDTVRECTGDIYPVIRLMPNTPAAIGKGTILITAADNVQDESVEDFKGIMCEAGMFERLPESQIDITSSINGCAPAYAYMFIEALADGAVQVGVPRDRAIRLAAQTVLGSAAMVLETGKHPDQLKDEVCSPGGSTIVGVTALEENRFRYAAAQSIIRSTEKNCSLGK